MAAIWSLAAAATVVKLLFMPAYRSTDFEVHRNWLAVTHSLHVQQWYVEETSEWTLDYPPLFAWFERVMSYFAQYFDPNMLVVSNLNYASEATVMFQRLSVIVTDFVYYYAVKEFHWYSFVLKRGVEKKDFNLAIIPVLLIFNMGLFVVDHIHFQYNGILFGIMLLSLVRILQGKNLEGAFWFAFLLNMKHIYMYVAPAYFIYLLRTHCFTAEKPVSLARFSARKFVNLAAVVGVVFIISFGPFIYFQQIGQVLSRLFPFKRGLVHAYWAPNLWALYTAGDKMLTIAAVKWKLISPSTVSVASMTGGMVQEYKHVILPSISPGLTLLLVIFGIVPVLFTLWEKRTGVSFVRAVILCAFTSFMLGWHVHEKAVLIIIIPMTLLALYSKQDARLFLIMSTTGYFSLFPLLFTPFENILKVLLLLMTCIFSFLSLESVYGKEKGGVKSTLNDIQVLRPFRLPLLNSTESLYIWGLAVLGVFNSLGMWLLTLGDRFPFLPLLLTSVYCALGILYCWVEFYRLSLNEMRLPLSEKEEKVSTLAHRKKKL